MGGDIQVGVYTLTHCSPQTLRHDFSLTAAFIFKPYIYTFYKVLK